MALIKPRPSPPAHLKKILLLVCLVYFCNVFFLHFLRTMAAYMSPYIAEPPGNTHKISSIISFIYIPSIFLGIFVGRISDILKPDLALAIFSMVSCSGLFLLYIFAEVRTGLGFLYLSMLVYGTGSNLSKIPMQKITSILFAGPHLAFALNITQVFSHLAGIVSSRISPILLKLVGYPKIFLVIFLITALNLPLLLILIQLVKLRSSYSITYSKDDNKQSDREDTISKANANSDANPKNDKDYNQNNRTNSRNIEVHDERRIEEIMEIQHTHKREKRYRESLRRTSKLRNLRKKKPGIKDSFAKLLFGVDRTFFIVLLMAFFVDGVQVCYKNLESLVYKDIFKFDSSTFATILMLTKMINLLTPFSSIIVDRWKYRQYYFLISVGTMLACHGVFYTCYVNEYVLNKVLVVIIGASMRLAFSLFQSSFYSFFAIVLHGNIRGFGFGVVLSVLATAHSLFPVIYVKLRMKSYIIYIMLEVVGLFIGIVLFFVNIRKKDILNKDKKDWDRNRNRRRNN